VTYPMNRHFPKGLHKSYATLSSSEAVVKKSVLAYEALHKQ